MSAQTLEQLGRLRAEEVERARRAMRACERACDEAAEVCRAARVRVDAREHALVVARRAFAVARTVEALRWASAAVEAALRARSTARHAQLRAEQRLAASERAVRAQRDAVRTRELARRAVARTIARRAQEVTLRTERLCEDELDDAHRARVSSR